MKKLDSALNVLATVMVLASCALTAAVMYGHLRRHRTVPEPAGEPDPAAYHVAQVLQEARDITEQAARP